MRFRVSVVILCTFVWYLVFGIIQLALIRTVEVEVHVPGRGNSMGRVILIRSWGWADKQVRGRMPTSACLTPHMRTNTTDSRKGPVSSTYMCLR